VVDQLTGRFQRSRKIDWRTYFASRPKDALQPSRQGSEFKWDTGEACDLSERGVKPGLATAAQQPPVNLERRHGPGGAVLPSAVAVRVPSMSSVSSVRSSGCASTMSWRHPTFRR